jgi:Tc toxin complex TcA C-terminal TcB-binding domain
MPNAIVIRIVPQKPMDPLTFQGLLSESGGLTINVYAINYGTVGQTSPPQIGSASYVAVTPAGFWNSAGASLSQPSYPAGLTTGIVQQVDRMPPVFPDPAYFQLESVATAIIEITAASIENIRLELVWGAGTPTQVTPDYYDIQLGAAPAPDLSAWSINAADPNPQPDLWAQIQQTSLYLDLTASPSGSSLQLPSDGSAPAFTPLKQAMLDILAKDPSGFTPSQLGALTPAQCENLAYEILWSQQPVPPAPPNGDPLEDLYTNPPNSGNLLDGTNPNNQESDRRQFEAQLQSYYEITNAAASRLANYVFAVAAAVACEQTSLAATQVLLSFPANPSQPGATFTQPQVIFTGIGGLSPALTFGVPSGYFYALASEMPTNITPQQRYQMATGDQIQRTLDSLTAAIASEVVTDAEAFVTAAGSINAAQAARRIDALGVPNGSTTPLAPLGAFALATSAISPAGANLSFSATAAANGGLTTNDGVTVSGGLTASGVGLAAVTEVQAVPSATTVTVSPAFASAIPAGASITFSPKNPPQMDALIGGWLSYPPTQANAISSQAYSPISDVAALWPALATAQPLSFLNLVLSALTQGFILPPPFNEALGSEIVAWMAKAPVSQPQNVAGLVAVTTQQWTQLFQQNPTWLPGQYGDPNARIAAFLQSLKTYLSLPNLGPVSALNLATSAPTPNNSQNLPFASTTGASLGMSVTSASTTFIQGETLVSGVTANSVTLSKNTLGGVIPFGTNILFTPNLQGALPATLPSLPAPATDWIGECLAAYNAAFKFGDGIALPNPALVAAAATVFPDDLNAQKWVFDAIVAIDALFQIINKMAPPPGPAGLAFSIVESLYARGFVSAASVTEMSEPDFQQALIGTIAYVSANNVYTAAALIKAPNPSPASPGPFRPINPDGLLVNCVPPPCQSPLGAIAYLSEMLKVSPDSTCEEPLIPQAASTLAVALETRRGPLGQLSASCANLETPLPLIDIANENLEFMGSNLGQAHGVVFDTSEDVLDGFALCRDEPCEEVEHHRDCHEPAEIFSALPEHSSPVTRTLANGNIDPTIYDMLRVDFSACSLPYSQPLDVNRAYLRHLGSCRYEEMRAFRKCITEFVLDPVGEPVGFQSHLWRYPVRIELAVEYLGLTPEEYSLIFQGLADKPCAVPVRRDGDTTNSSIAALPAWELYGFAEAGQRPSWIEVVTSLPEFLKRTCLSYCDFVELWKSSFVAFFNRGDERTRGFPECEPCCLDRISIELPGDRETWPATLGALAVFIRLWHILKRQCCDGYSFAQLRDICDVLHLFQGNAINPDFIRQLAALRMLCDHFGLPLMDREYPPAAGAIDADRTALLALWAQPPAAKSAWAIRKFIVQVEQHAIHHHRCERRKPEFLKILTANLDPLSKLAGFDPTSPTDSWRGAPTHTLRFAEILSKIYASPFTVGELLFLFTTEPHLEGDDPFPMPTQNDDRDSPLALPEESHPHSLWRLRDRLRGAEGSEAEFASWGWKRIETELQSLFGFAATEIHTFGAHFFPGVLRQSGYQVTDDDERFFSALASAETMPQTWNSPPERPFHYDPASQRLSARVPIGAASTLAKLLSVHALDSAEETAVQDLFFQPRALLAKFALLFGDFQEAIGRLVGDGEEHQRWSYFQRQFAACVRRCHVIAEHLEAHVAAATGRERPVGAEPAMLILRELFADENGLAGSPAPNWENDSGDHSAVIWTPPANGGAYAALLALTGTGLIAEYSIPGGAVVWRDVSGDMSAFGERRNHENCPVPTVLPALNANIPLEQLQFVSVTNGFLMKDSTDEWLGGAQGFEVKWRGALLVDEGGAYEFFAGAPTPEEQRPDVERIEDQEWRVMLSRGQQEWVLIAHRWPGHETRDIVTQLLKRGTYEIRIELRRPTPKFYADEKIRREVTGFQIKYCGPDSDGRRIALPHDRLFAVDKDGPLSTNVTTLSGGASDFLNTLYVGSFRDIRRTYQRAFKALLFARRFHLSAHRRSDGASELGYVLAQKSNFAGASYYKNGAAFQQHEADFDFNYLPVSDEFHSPFGDSRAHPSAQRTQAMFDWWERTYDYAHVRAAVRRRCDRELWRLFDDAFDKQPTDPKSLLRHMGADVRHWPLDLQYFQGQHSPVYGVNCVDLEDDRWTVRVWHADEWLRAAQHAFDVKDITKARPDLWASDDPGALVFAETTTGNANLISLVCAGAFDNGDPKHYEEIRRLDNGIRERSRDALVAYLCQFNRVALPWPGSGFATRPDDLTDLLLIDVKAGIPEKLSRINEAINAAQTFIRRARIGLEPEWKVSPEFARMWDREFATFHVWQACKRRHLYKEDWIEWGEVGKARRVEAFDFLESKLRSSELTAAAPGGLVWWPDENLPIHRSLELLQKAEASKLKALNPPREGLGLLGSPEKNAQPSWLSPVGGVPKVVVGIQANAVAAPPKPEPVAGLPLWMEAAVRLGATFIRVAAAGAPPAGSPFSPHKGREPGCVSCCSECGCEHEAHVDEYYFWLIRDAFYDSPPLPAGFSGVETDDGYQFGFQDDFYDPAQQEAAYWWDPTQLPQLLAWQTSPSVRLAWCRVHNGEFRQPRRSRRAVAVAQGASADLQFVRRAGDSLYFLVTNAAPPPLGHKDTSPPGFRYDLARDEAITLPLVATAAPDPTFFNGSLAAYPFFAYVAPGDRLFPLSPYAPAITVAKHLRAHCLFEAALKWYRLAFDPVSEDCAWKDCSLPPEQRLGVQSACCDSTDVDCDTALARSIVLNYLETLREWGDAIMRRGNSPESLQQARVLFSAARRILGERPETIIQPEPSIPQTVANFAPEFPPLNPRLLDIYDVVCDRMRTIHEYVDAHRLPIRISHKSTSYFGDDPVRRGWKDRASCCGEESDWCQLPSPYRFTFLIQKAQEYAMKAQELGNALLAAYEKGDGEFLASLRAQYEGELLSISLDAKKDQWRDADWQVETLQKTKAISQANLTYYSNLIQNGLISGEIAYQDLTAVSIALRGAGNIIEATGEAMNSAGNYFDGIAGFGGTPLIYQQLPIGEPIGSALAGAARVMGSLAEIANSSASLSLTEAGWQRRNDDWVHQAQILTIEIQQVERQILAAQRRRDQMLVELNSHRRQMEQADETQNFLRDKFTSFDLYLFLQRETSALYFRTYDLALRIARQAEHAFNLERGHTARHFLPENAWDRLREGLLAGDRLSETLRHMEKCYLDENVREYELTKHVSLRLNSPAQFLLLKTTGACEIDIPEWMFDVDYPGHYLRRLRSITLTIPCVAGPYSGVHCRLTLLTNITRVNPLLTAPAHGCCCPDDTCCCDHERADEGYRLCADDPRMVKLYGAREAIATSGGQNDAGLFELNFNDPRYLPFEYMGAISRWRIELPKENNYFNFDSLTDLVMHINYTAREGEEALRKAARTSACRKTPGDGWALFDVRQEFPNSWELFRRSRNPETGHWSLNLRLTRKHLPFLPHDPEVSITKLGVLFETEGGDGDQWRESDCPCPEPPRRAFHTLELVEDMLDEDERSPRLVKCVSASEYGDLYDGIADVRAVAFRRGKDGREFKLKFPHGVGEVTRVYILCGYQKDEDCCCRASGRRRSMEWRGKKRPEVETPELRDFRASPA